MKIAKIVTKNINMELQMNNSITNYSISTACVLGFHSLCLSNATSSSDRIAELAIGIILASGVYMADISFNWTEPDILERPKTRKILLENPEKAKFLAVGIRILHAEGILEVPGNLEILLKNQENAGSFAIGLVALHQEGILGMPDNRETLLASPENAYSLAKGLITSHCTGILEMTGIREALLACPKYAVEFAHGLTGLYNNDLLEMPGNLEILLACPKYAVELTQGLIVLHQNGILEIPGTRETLLESPKYAATLAYGLWYLNKTDILTQGNVEYILESPKNAVALAQGIERLHQVGILEMPGIRETLLACPEDAFWTASELAILHKGGVLTQGNFNALTRDLKNAPKLISGLGSLRLSLNSSQENFNALTRDPEKAKFLAKGLAFLQQHSMLTQNSFEYLLLNPENAEYLAKGLHALYHAGIMTEPNRKELLRGNGAHAIALVNNLKPGILLDQERFNRIMKSVWAPRRLATKMLAMRNKLLAQEKYLPWNVINLISANVAPPYDSEPFDVSATIAAVESRPGWTPPKNRWNFAFLKRAWYAK